MVVDSTFRLTIPANWADRLQHFSGRLTLTAQREDALKPLPRLAKLSQTGKMRAKVR